VIGWACAGNLTLWQSESQQVALVLRHLRQRSQNVNNPLVNVVLPSELQDGKWNDLQRLGAAPEFAKFDVPNFGATGACRQFEQRLRASFLNADKCGKCWTFDRLQAVLRRSFGGSELDLAASGNTGDTETGPRGPRILSMGIDSGHGVLPGNVCQNCRRPQNVFRWGNFLNSRPSMLFAHLAGGENWRGMQA
jgi:hypothetical protein